MLAVTDCAIAAQNAVTAADSLGLGSCYIGDIMEQCEFHRELLAPHAGRRPYGEWLKAFCDRKYQSDFSREMSRSVEEYLKPFLDE